MARFPKLLRLLKFRGPTLPKHAAALPMKVEWPDGRVEWVYGAEGQGAN